MLNRYDYILRSVVVCVLVFAAGCGAEPNTDKLPKSIRQALANPELFELFSLEPKSGHVNSPDSFHDWVILGSTQVTDRATLERLASALLEAMVTPIQNVPSCFNPRHGVRLTAGGTIVEIVICFECKQYQPFATGTDGSFYVLSGAPASLFNQVLEEAAVPLAKQPQY